MPWLLELDLTQELPVSSEPVASDTIFEIISLIGEYLEIGKTQRRDATCHRIALQKGYASKSRNPHIQKQRKNRAKFLRES
jgi:hypothetical protein